jgi:hypothetical protein
LVSFDPDPIYIYIYITSYLTKFPLPYQKKVTFPLDYIKGTFI